MIGWNFKGDGDIEGPVFGGGGQGLVGLAQHDILGAPCLMISKCQNLGCIWPQLCFGYSERII